MERKRCIAVHSTYQSNLSTAASQPATRIAVQSVPWWSCLLKQTQCTCHQSPPRWQLPCALPTHGAGQCPLEIWCPTPQWCGPENEKWSEREREVSGSDGEAGKDGGRHTPVYHLKPSKPVISKGTEECQVQSNNIQLGYCAGHVCCSNTYTKTRTERWYIPWKMIHTCTYIQTSPTIYPPLSMWPWYGSWSASAGPPHSDVARCWASHLCARPTP